MAGITFICAILLWSVCIKGYEIRESKESSREYPTEPTEYTTDANTDGPYTEPTEGPVSQRVKFRCPSDGLFAYPPDCTRFIQCSNGRPFVMNCPEGLHFSRRIGRCDYPCSAQCSPLWSEQCGDEKTNEVCSLPRKKGQCKSYVVRYYFDVSESKCKKFVFGGCNGNENNFKSEKQCMEVCGQGVAEDTATRDSSDAYPTEDTRGYSRLHSQESTDASWIPENEATSPESDSWTDPEGRATETTEDYPSYSTDTGPREPGEDSWGHTFAEFVEDFPNYTTDIGPSEDSRGSSFTEDSRGGDDYQPGDGRPSRYPDEDSHSTETAYSFRARVSDDFRCRGQGAFRNPDDCASFIWCPLDRAVVVPCPPNTHYSEQRDACVDPCLAHCNASLACSCGWPECHQYNLIDCESDPDAGPCPDRELRYFYDRERGRCKSFYYGGCHGNGNNFRTLRECQRECQTSLLAGFRCPSYNGDFGHYPDCVSYYQCKRGIPTLKRCPKGTAFHHLKAKCVPEQEAMCVYECREPNAVYPANKDCRSYINCVNGIPKLEKCPRGLAFDVNKRNCVLERTTSCTW